MSYEKNINLIRKDDKFFIIHNGWPFDLSPPPIMKLSLPPYVSGLDYIIREGARIKQIKGNIDLMISDDWFFKCDVRANFKKMESSGSIYTIQGEQINIDSQDVWVCPHLQFFFEKPPELLFLKINSVSA